MNCVEGQRLAGLGVVAWRNRCEENANELLGGSIGQDRVQSFVFLLRKEGSVLGSGEVKRQVSFVRLGW